jgi:Collagen triple helix repeat (20 copies)
MRTRKFVATAAVATALTTICAYSVTSRGADAVTASLRAVCYKQPTGELLAARIGSVPDGCPPGWKMASVQGKQGKPGKRGPRGLRGQKGERGEVQVVSVGTGEAAVISGPKGDRGEKGDKGDRGPQGERGLQGAQGAKGDQGAPGTAGAPGAAGAPGVGMVVWTPTFGGNSVSMPPYQNGESVWTSAGFNVSGSQAIFKGVAYGTVLVPDCGSSFLPNLTVAVELLVAGGINGGSLTGSWSQQGALENTRVPFAITVDGGLWGAGISTLTVRSTATCFELPLGQQALGGVPVQVEELNTRLIGTQIG